MDTMPRLEIYYWDFFFIISGDMGNVPAHSHNALQIFIDRAGKQKIEVDDSILCEPVIFVAGNTPHSVIRSGSEQLTVLIDNDSDAAKHFSHSCFPGGNYAPDTKLFKSINTEDPLAIKRHLLDLLKAEGCPICSFSDSRIIKVKEFIDTDEEKKLSLMWLSEQVGLSESRLAHLFKEEVGIPLRKYLLWKRLMSALEIILEGHNLTYAAHLAGFSDSAHLSRTFKSNFGLNLSKIFKNSRFIQFHSL